MRKDIDEIALAAFNLAVKADDSTIIRLLTKREKIAIGRRLIIAQAILAGKTRAEINERIKISPNTFAQINRWLETEFGDYCSAYKTAVDQRSKRHVSKHIRPFSYEHLKKKYPAQFFIFSVVEELWKQK
ncbi:hypothetical protein CL655_03070 [bacterium]|nr:hypothetical protein [bacterium]|tara:strand:- start:164 stop:553 length:390 start_codon:yes stop_codon:yes gene_type:complete